MSSLPPLALSGLTLSSHAVSTMRRRDVWPEEVAAALTHWDVREDEGAGRVRFVLGPLVVVLADADTAAPVVVTVLLRSREQWTDADAVARSAVA